VERLGEQMNRPESETGGVSGPTETRTSPSTCPRFSIITATFNRADLLPRCLDSILRQSFDNFEAIIVDDGSSDNTEAVVAEYRLTDTRVRYLQQDNRGANSARNYGAREAHGEYILVLDSDDDAYSHWLARLDQLIASSRPAVACCGIESWDCQGRYKGAQQPAEDLVGSNRGGLFLSGTYAVRRNVFSELGGFNVDLPAHQHTEFRMRLFELCERRDYRIVSIPDRLVRAHRHDGQSIRRDARAKLEATDYILTHHRDKFQSPRSISSWLASAGGCAAELGRYQDARAYFGEAIRMQPTYWKNYVRLAICYAPCIRRLFWRSTGEGR